MATIDIGKGYAAIVDDDDLPRLSRFRWATRGKGRSVYAYRTTVKNEDGLGAVSMQRLIVGESIYFIDHINGNTLDNRRANLRHATPAQNCANRRKIASTASVYLGVQPANEDGWKATISKDGRKYQSYHRTELEAAIVRDAKARELFGEFATLNFPTKGEMGAVRQGDLTPEIIKKIGEIYSSYEEKWRLQTISNNALYQERELRKASASLANELYEMLESKNAKPMVRVGLSESRVCDGEASSQKGGRGGATCSGRA